MKIIHYYSKLFTGILIDHLVSGPGTDGGSDAGAAPGLGEGDRRVRDVLGAAAAEGRAAAAAVAEGTRSRALRDRWPSRNVVEV